MHQRIPAWVDDRLQPVEKLEVHERGLRHPAVSIFVVAQDRLLIQQRALEKYHTPGLWANTCCTHPLWGETASDCAIRRLDEELGIRGLSLEHRGQVEYRAPVGRDMIEHEVVDLYLARCEVMPEVTPNPAEVRAVEWVNAGALRRAIDAETDDFTPWLQIYLKDHADKVLPGF